MFSVITLHLSAQVKSKEGRFETTFAKGCIPFKVVINETDTFPPETVRQYDFNGDGVFVGFEPDEEVSYTYNSPGVYRIVQVINVDIEPKTDTLTVEAFPDIQPEFTVFTCENNGARVDIQPDQYEQYRVFYTASDSVTVNSGEEVPSYSYSPGTHEITVKGLFVNGKNNCGLRTRSFTTIENLVPAEMNNLYMVNRNIQTGMIDIHYTLEPGVVYYLENTQNFLAGFQVLERLPSASSSISVDSLDTENTVQIFRISAYDACQEKYVYSDTLSSVILSGTAENGQNRLNWESVPAGFDQYEIYRDGKLIGSIRNKDLQQFVDEDVVCFNEYCYTVLYSDENGNSSFSDTLCLEAFRIFFPPPLTHTTASVVDGAVELSWLPPENMAVSAYFVQRQVEGDVFATVDTVTGTQFRDIEPDVDDSRYCYRISYLDECNNRSNLGDLACTIYLDIEENRLLSWTDHRGWETGTDHYVIEFYDEQMALESEVDVGRENFHEIENYLRDQISPIRIRGVSRNDPPDTAFSNLVIKQIESVLRIPNAFTPNGDGLNDLFVVKGTLMKEFIMKIYSRSGDLIFETTDQLQGWDGTYKGREMPFNTYIYSIKAVDEVGKTLNREGKILLIRQ